MHGVCGHAEIVTLENAYSLVSIDSTRAALVQWRTCYRPCAEIQNPAYSLELGTAHRPVEFAVRDLQLDSWTLVSRSATMLELSAHADRSGARPARLRVELRGRYEIGLTFDGDPAGSPMSIRVAPPSAFDRGQAHGFATSREIVDPVAIVDSAVVAGRQIENPPEESQELTPARDFNDWIGFRNRFWALLANEENGRTHWRYRKDGGALPGQWEAELAPHSTVLLYAGPLSPPDLRVADPELVGLLFHGLWWWLRWLCLGMLFLLNGLEALMHSWGVAILALSVIVKVLITPLTRIAERWQAQVNRIQSQLQPRIDAIKRECKGEEQANRILAAHKEFGVTPFYTFKSTIGFLIQIPVFIAAFNVLNEAAGLNGAGFLWIEDLAKPDRFLALPFAIPFFGGYLNLLPVLMTLVTLLASWLTRDHCLSTALQVRRRRTLYGMALLFFVLFYTFPAGMVLYWTSNVVLQAIRDLIRRAA